MRLRDERRLLNVREESRTLHLPLALNTNEIKPLITDSSARETIIEQRATMHSRTALININCGTSEIRLEYEAGFLTFPDFSSILSRA